MKWSLIPFMSDKMEQMGECCWAVGTHWNTGHIRGPEWITSYGGLLVQPLHFSSRVKYYPSSFSSRRKKKIHWRKNIFIYKHQMSLIWNPDQNTYFPLFFFLTFVCLYLCVIFIFLYLYLHTHFIFLIIFSQLFYCHSSTVVSIFPPKLPQPQSSPLPTLDPTSL